MNRLSRYIFMQFLTGALAYYLITLSLVWLTNLLRLFQLVSDKGQNLFTLFLQSFLSTPLFARDFLVICMGLGLIRCFKNLQASRELHTIHVTNRLGAIWGSAMMFALLGAVFVSFIAHWVQPASNRSLAIWKSEIAAELVSDNLPLGRITSIADGVVVGIRGRAGDGTLIDFFADDYRDGGHRTYMADEAIIIQQDGKYLISLRNGHVETVSDQNVLQSLAFDRYELAIDSLTRDGDISGDFGAMDSFEVWTQSDQMERTIAWLAPRFAEAPRILGMMFCLTALMMFPHARRGRNYIPFELIMLLVCLVERSVTRSLGSSFVGGYFAGAAAFFGLGLLIIAMRNFDWAARKRFAAQKSGQPQDALQGESV